MADRLLEGSIGTADKGTHCNAAWQERTSYFRLSSVLCICVVVHTHTQIGKMLEKLL